LLFQLDSNCYCWRRCRQVLLGNSLGFCDSGGSSFHVVGKILIKVIRIVVVEVETLRGVVLRFMDFRDANHEDFTAKIFEFLGLVCLRTGLVECSARREDPLAENRRC
jgi:hypothetical protein